MKTLYLPIAILGFLLTAAPLSSQSTFSPEDYMDFRREHLNYTGEELLRDHAPKTTYYESRQTPSQLERVPWFDSLNTHFSFTPDEKEILADHHFMVSERLSFHTWADALLSVYRKDLPLFLSSDLVLNSLHSSYDLILLTLEWQFLEPNLHALLHAMYDHVPEIAKKYEEDERMMQAIIDADLYISVALSLAKADEYLPHYEKKSSYTAVMQAVAAEKMTTMPLFTETRGRKLDFSQFTPRGHYTHEIYTTDGVRTLEDYFRAMMWLGRIDFLLTAPPADGELPWTDEELRRMQLGALMVNEVLFGCGKKDLLDTHEAIISYLVGPDDNLTPGELKELSDRELSAVSDLFDEASYMEFKAKLNASDDYGQKIMSNFFCVDPFSDSPDQLPVSYKLLGQKFLVDSYVFSEVVFDRIIFEGQKIWRPLPDPLDAMAALGNEDALALLQEEMETYKYAANMAGLKYLIESYDEDFWEQSLYNTWLGALRELNPPSSSENLPYFMQTTAWHHEKLNTQLVSWAQLRHDNLLYGKQSYTGGVSCSYPYTYVEPYPEFYSKVGSFATQAARFFGEELGEISFESREAIAEFYEHYAGIMETLGAIAQKELEGSPLDETEISFLKTMISLVMEGCAVGITGWVNDLYFNPQKLLEGDYTIADVHTQPTDQNGAVVGNILHVGNGMINLGVFLTDNPTNPGQLMAFAGPVSSFHSEVQPNFTRLNDQDWEARFWEGTLPPRPDWVSPYLLDEEGKKYPKGRSLKGRVYAGTSSEDGIRQRDLDYMLLYPNPSTGTAALRFLLNQDSDLRIRVYDTSGKLVHQEILQDLAPAEHHHPLPVAAWQRGLYLVRLDIGGESMVRELVVQ
jgi:hypothetical protein